jgi:capsular exopolysaccharide synthesis family protein
MKETGVAAGVETAPYRVIEEPMIPSKPSKPHRSKILAIALVLLTVTSVFWLMIRDALSSTIRSVDQAESLLGLPVLGAIPDNRLSTTEVLASNFRNKEKKKRSSKASGRSGTGEKKDQRHYLIAPVDDPGSILSESYRTLRASITLLGPKEQTRILLFTSAIPDEGKTFSSINCAVTFAQQGDRTLIIDSDMRRPSVHHALLDGEERRGLTDFLSGQATLDELICETGIKGLSLLTAGSRAPNPAELLLQADIPALMQELLTRFDRIIIDSAPVNAVSDTLYIAGPARQVVLVVRSDKTPSKAVQRAIIQLRKSGTHMAGIVLNRVRRGSGEGYYFYYSYGNKYHKDSVYGSS